ncbi:hypothetical protein [Rhizobium rhizogenes]|nr:hypothetical protein [Rhizobium rhizogenes]
MNESDERFLKDLGWSELWFPWKNKGRVILVRSDSRGAWDKIAIVLSSLALVVSSFATIATWRQVDLMRSQMTSNERNSAFSKLALKLDQYCQTLLSVDFVPAQTGRRNSSEIGVQYSLALDELHSAIRDFEKWSTEDQIPVIADISIWVLVQQLRMPTKDYVPPKSSVSIINRSGCALVTMRLSGWYRGSTRGLFTSQERDEIYKNISVPPYFGGD